LSNRNFSQNGYLSQNGYGDDDEDEEEEDDDCPFAYISRF